MKENSKMYFYYLKSTIFLTLLLFSIGQSFAQSTKVPSLNPDKHITQFSIDTWDTEQGLPSKSLLFLKQTSDGYLWIASFQGLFRFDGITFENFNDSKTSNGLHTNVVNQLFEREDGTLCIGTSDEGLIGYKNGEFTTLGQLDYAIQTTLFDTPTHGFVGTKVHGVYELNDTTFTPYTKVPALQNIRVSDIMKDKEGNLWFVTEGRGVVKLDKEENSTIFTMDDGLLSNKVATIFQDSQSKIWIGTNEGLCFFENGQIKSVEETQNYPINRILEDYYGSIWMASDKGLLRLNVKTKAIEILNQENGLPHKNVQNIVLDREGSLWFAMYRAGLGRIKEGKFSNYTQNSGLASKAISAVHEIGENEYLVATDAGGIINRVKDNKVSVFDFKTKLANDRIKDLNSDSRGNILISTYSGLLVIDPDGKETLYDKRNGLPGNQVRVSFEDNLGNIWIGTRVNGLIKITPDGVLSYHNKQNSDLSSNFIMSISQDKTNRLLVGTNSAGLDVINMEDGKFEVTNYTKELTGKLVFSTYTDSDNVTWVTGNTGLTRLEEGKTTLYTTKNGLPVNICYDVLEDHEGYFWVSSSAGIMRIAKQELNDFAKGAIERVNAIKMFDKADGMISKECTGATFCVKTQDGSLMFPTLAGVTFIDPHNIPINNVKPPVSIEKLVVDNQEVNLYKDIDIQSGKQRLTFHFTALSLIAPQNVSLKYKLEGYDENWTDSQGGRQTVYTGLPHGQYTFKVKASNNDGVWNEEGASLSFRIYPRFYETQLFYIVSFLAIGLLIFGFYRFRVRSIKQKNEELEALVLKRTHEINTQTEELLSQKEALLKQKDKIEDQNKSLELAYNDVSTLSQIGKEVTATLDTAKLNRVLYESVNKLMKADGFGVGVYNRKTNCLDFSNYIENGEYLPFLAEKVNETDSLAVKCFKNQEVVLVQDLTNALPYKNISSEDTHGLQPKALIYVPLLVKNKPVGVVTVQSFATNVYIDSHVTILQTLGSYIAIALVNADSYTIIQDKNKLITDSIRYAERIQQAVLPSQQVITDLFAENFIIFSPKDIVSGDFYWFNQVKNKTFVVVADCTGHGVPGAFMSMIGISSLNDVINKENIHEPAEILAALNQKIRHSLHQDETDNNDGMDIALCVLEKTENEMVNITFSGAKRPLFYSEKGELKIVKGNRKSIGGSQNKKTFTQENISLAKGDTIYLFSDGIIDQSSPKRRRFGTPLLTKILTRGLTNSLSGQKNSIIEALKKHQGTSSQRDDIAMVGIRF
jgi:ligand-binding sensor domain-containing protein/serine phosphatase RsbU (regulator of sigma subunit)